MVAPGPNRQFYTCLKIYFHIWVIFSTPFKLFYTAQIEKVPLNESIARFSAQFLGTKLENTVLLIIKYEDSFL